MTADAILYPRDQAAIVPKISAPVKKFYVDRGSQVRAGQLLAELENGDSVGALTENQGGYQQAEAAYQTAAQKAQQDLVGGQAAIGRAAEALRQPPGPLQARSRFGERRADARIASTQAQDQYEAAQKQVRFESCRGTTDAAQGKKASAEAQLSYAKIVSPIDGVVTDRPIFAGETAPSGLPFSP